MKIVQYSSKDRIAWDQFIAASKNPHFFFQRDYMEYHSDRFEDCSLLVYNDKGGLVALLPANRKDDVVYSHQGLTFGGFVVDDRMKVEMMLAIFKELKAVLKEHQVSRLVYKCIPHIYHLEPSEEDRYALFVNEARLTRREVTCTIDLTQDIRYSGGRKWNIRKARRENLQVMRSYDFKRYWELLTSVLKAHHGVAPVHSCEEMEQLARLFPDNIKLYIVCKNDQLLSGMVLFENANISHAQYAANSPCGRELCALDFLIDHLIKEVAKHKRFFDFGTSSADNGRGLNCGLISQKERYGASAVAHDFYELPIA